MTVGLGTGSYGVVLMCACAYRDQVPPFTAQYLKIHISSTLPRLPQQLKHLNKLVHKANVKP